jgi:uncharacterized protein YjbI with pentapeptide repeats
MKPLRLGLLTKTMPHKGKGLFIVSTFTLFDLLDPTDILAETAMWPLIAKELPKGTVFDAAYPKPFGEFLIAGQARSQAPVKAMHVAVTVGERSRMLSVFGDRTWQAGAEGPVFTDPRPFTEMPLTPDRAFGGEGFAANPAGQGAAAAELFGEIPHLRLPNVELAGAEIREIDDKPAPALVGPMPMDDAARMALAGTYDKAWVAHRMPDWPEDFDPRYFLSARREQQIEGFFKGTEAVRVVGMSETRPDVHARLPGVRARAFVNRASVPDRLTEIPMHTDTVWILGSEMKGIVVNRGVLAVGDRDGRDINDVMVAYEWLKDAPRPADHYQSVYALRADPEEGKKYLLADSQLSPEEAPEDIERREADRLAAATERQDLWVEGRQWNLERQFAEQGLPAALVPAIQKPDLKPFLLPTDDDIACGDVDFARLISDAEDLRREAELKADMVSAELAGLVEQFGVTSPVMPPAGLGEMEELGHSVSTGKGFLPAIEELVPQDDLDKLLAQYEEAPTPDVAALSEKDPQAAFEGARIRFEDGVGAGLLAPARDLLDRMPDTPLAEPAVPAEPETAESAAALEGPGAGAGSVEPGELDGYLAATFPDLAGEGGSPSDNLKSAITGGKPADASIEDPGAAVRRQLDQAQDTVDTTLATSRRMAAEPIAPLEPLGVEAAGLLGQHVRNHLSAGGTLAGRDLAGASLASAALSAADLSGSFLERCDLSGADLRSARCEETVLAGALLEDTDLSAATFSGANLSGVQARRSNFGKARLEDSKVIAADFSGCDFAGAVIKDCTFVNCQFSGAVFTGAAIDGCSFVNCNLSGLHAEQLRMDRSNFLSCNLDRSDCCGAMMKKVTFAGVDFHAVKMCHALLDECGWFGKTDMRGVNFLEAHATKCGFQDARMSDAGFFKAIFHGCNMSGADLKLADMRLSSWNGSMFSFANAQKADFFGANLLGAGFHGADLTEASFRSANFFRTDLSEATLVFADLTGSNLVLTNLEARQ